MYEAPFIITEEVGNNAISFNKRPQPALKIPGLVEGSLDDVAIGEGVTFEDFDEHNVLQSCTGLKNLVRMTHPETGAPLIVVDNHNHVFWFWYEAMHRGIIQRGATLVHIDQHKDTRQPPRNISPEEAVDLEKVFRYTNYVLNVGNYIPPAMQEGLVGDLISITSEAALLEHAPQKTDASLIVNVDLDFWAPELDYMDDAQRLKITKEWMRHADLITVATSPFFIDQNRAIGVLCELLN